MFHGGQSIQADRCRKFPDVAAFLNLQQEVTARDDPTQARPQGANLRWLLDNPHLGQGRVLGETIRTSDGKILGMISRCPGSIGSVTIGSLAWRRETSMSMRRLGCRVFSCSGAFWVPQGVDFWYANSCNRQSGDLWAKCGGAMVPESDVEYLFPFRLGPLVEELAARRQWPRPVAGLLRATGPLATLVAAPRRPRNQLTIDYCTDLDRLAAVAECDRDPGPLQPDRSADYLNWMYGSLPSTPLENAPRVIYRFADRSGSEGWFALEFGRRGGREQIRCARVTDVVWPPGRFSATDVLPAIIEVAHPRADVLSIRGRVGLALPDGVKGVRSRPLLAPEGFLVSRTPSTGELVKLADFPFADRY